MARNLYSNDNAAFRQFVGGTLQGIKQEIANIDNLDPANIKSGTKILGYTGTYTNEEVNVAATALDIAAGKVAYINGERIVGVAGIAEYTFTLGAAEGTGTGNVTVDGDAYTNPIDYVAGSEIELIATPDAGSVFAGWKIGADIVSDEAEFIYTMEMAAVTIIPVFNPN